MNILEPDYFKIFNEAINKKEDIRIITGWRDVWVYVLEFDPRLLIGYDIVRGEKVAIDIKAIRDVAYRLG